MAAGAGPTQVHAMAEGRGTPGSHRGVLRTRYQHVGARLPRRHLVVPASWAGWTGRPIPERWRVRPNEPGSEVGGRGPFGATDSDSETALNNVTQEAKL